MAQQPRAPQRPPARPTWVKVSLIILAVILAVVVIAAIMGGEHGPGRHLPGGNASLDTFQNTP